MSHDNRSSRRSFLKQATWSAFAAPAFIQNLRAASPSEVVRHASFGASGMANADLSAIVSHPKTKLVCVAEVDLQRAEHLRKAYPDVRVYQDWRQMLDKEAGQLDSVNVSTPDHMHASMAMASLERGLHVYGQNRSRTMSTIRGDWRSTPRKRSLSLRWESRFTPILPTVPQFS